MEETFRAPGAGLRLAPLALLLLVAVSLHVSALRAPFVGDDFAMLDEVGFRPLPGAVLAPDPTGDAFRPVGRQLHFWLIGHLCGASPVAAHVANLALFLTVLALLAWIAVRLVGPYAAILTVALAGMSYALEVPVLSASGAQYLIALAAALASIVSYANGARQIAAVALFLALLSNEAMVLAPLVAVVASRRPRELFRNSLRQAWPLLAAIGGWLVLWLGALLRHDLSLDDSGPFRWGAVPATFSHLLPVALGLEWKRGAGPALHIGWFGIGTMVVATAAVAWASARRRQGRTNTSSRVERRGPRGIFVGLLWAVGGSLPVILVIPTWSAHQYLFGLCGVWLLLGAWAARQPRWVGPTLVALAGLCSQNTLGLESVATAKDPWIPQSHVNRYSLMQEMQPVAHFAAELKRVRPKLPSGSTLFFSGVPHFWEVGGGRLVRWTYRDSTLRAYDLTVFSLDRTKGHPAYFFRGDGDSLHDLPPAELRDLAVGTLRQRRSGPAHEALMFAVQAEPDDWLSRYWLAWVEWSRGDTTAALGHLEHLGMRPGQGFKWGSSWAEKTLAAGDSLKAIELLRQAVRRQSLDPELHRRLASLARNQPGLEAFAEVEAFAARALERRPRARGPTV